MIWAERNAGQRFGRWLVVGRGGKTNYVRSLCDCGTAQDVYVTSLVQGRSESCGCLRREVLRDLRQTHGEAQRERKTKEYRAWSNMKTRCYNTAVEDYRDYGGRGIQVCSRWIESYEAFLEDMGRAPTPAYSIDRKDVNGDYTPSNCRWATPRQQANNTRRQLNRNTI